MGLPELELPVAIGYGDEKESKIVKGFFQPLDIIGYHDGYYPETGIFIYIRGGQPVQIALTLEDYQAKIQAYWKLVSGKQNIKQKLGIIN